MKTYNFSEKAIAEAAYYIWQNNGCPANTSLQDWNAAINQLNAMANAKKTTLGAGFGTKASSCKTSSCKTSSCKASTVAKKSAVKKVVKKVAKKSK